jgi:metal-dependent amidase/aminoacylase/carboxypeptidase family protein
MLIQKIKDLAKDLAPEFIEIRHHLHAHPELSYQEFETSRFIQEKLASYDIPFQVKAKIPLQGSLPYGVIWMRFRLWKKMIYPTNLQSRE